ncbi:MAG: sterol desaturase family protein [Gammaproteobacteria bacterium]
MLSFIASLVHYIESSFSLKTLLSGEMAAITLVLLFAVLSNLELHHPKLEQPRKGLSQSYRTNLSLLFFNSLVMSMLSISTLVVLFDAVAGKGLLTVVSNPILKIALSFLLLDFLHYIWHTLCHKFDGLWMFHKVHHNDQYINVSTAYRIHLVELLLTAILKSIYIISVGIDKKAAFAYEIIYPFFVMFHHTNITFAGEKLFGYLIVTPYLHRAHHSKEREEHDSNYGAILSIWDRLFGTLTNLEPAAVGIKGKSPQTFWGLIKFGFTVPAPVQSPIRASNEVCIDMNMMIAEAAYYRAEKRSFSPGYELYDWLEAKKEIMRQLNGDQYCHYQP